MQVLNSLLVLVMLCVASVAGICLGKTIPRFSGGAVFVANAFAGFVVLLQGLWVARESQVLDFRYGGIACALYITFLIVMRRQGDNGQRWLFAIECVTIPSIVLGWSLLGESERLGVWSVTIFLLFLVTNGVVAKGLVWKASMQQYSAELWPWSRLLLPLAVIGVTVALFFTIDGWLILRLVRISRNAQSDIKELLSSPVPDEQNAAAVYAQLPILHTRNISIDEFQTRYIGALQDGINRPYCRFKHDPSFDRMQNTLWNCHAVLLNHTRHHVSQKNASEALSNLVMAVRLRNNLEDDLRFLGLGEDAATLELVLNLSDTAPERLRHLLPMRRMPASYARYSRWNYSVWCDNHCRELLGTDQASKHHPYQSYKLLRDRWTIGFSIDQSLLQASGSSEFGLSQEWLEEQVVADVAIAAELYHRQHGSFPDEVADLEESDLSSQTGNDVALLTLNNSCLIGDSFEIEALRHEFKVSQGRMASGQTTVDLNKTWQVIENIRRFHGICLGEFHTRYRQSDLLWEMEHEIESQLVDRALGAELFLIPSVASENVLYSVLRDEVLEIPQDWQPVLTLNSDQLVSLKQMGIIEDFSLPFGAVVSYQQLDGRYCLITSSQALDVISTYEQALAQVDNVTARREFDVDSVVLGHAKATLTAVLDVLREGESTSSAFLFRFY